MMMKNYLIDMLNVGEDVQQRDAIEYALYSGWLTLTYDRDTDTQAITDKLPEFVEAFRRVAQENIEANEPLRELIGAI